MKTNVNGNESFVLQLADSQWQAHLSCLLLRGSLT